MRRERREIDQMRGQKRGEKEFDTWWERERERGKRFSQVRGRKERRES